MALTLAPAAVTGLATTAVSSSAVSLSWNASTGAAGYLVLRKGPTDAGYLTIGTPTTTAFTDSNVQAATTYSYEVTAQNTGGSSPASSPLSVNTATTAPSAPTALSATATSSTSVSLSWTASTGTVTAYHVERSTNGVNFTEIAGNVSSDRLHRLHRASQHGLYLPVRAENSGSFSGYSNTKQATTAPATPTGLADDIRIQLIGRPDLDRLRRRDGYQVLRKGPTDPGYVQIGTPTTTAYTDSTVLASTAYSYEVIAASAIGNLPGEFAAVREHRLMPHLPRPRLRTLPQHLQPPASPCSGRPTAKAIWPDTTSFARSSAAGPFTQLNAGLLTSPSYNDTTAPQAVISYYQVVAVNTSALSSAPATVSATRPAAAVTTTIFASTAAPASNLQNVNDPTITSSGGVELGMKFRSDVAGTVTGVRFYKGSHEHRHPHGRTLEQHRHRSWPPRHSPVKPPAAGSRSLLVAGRDRR